jgi:hypothetical protein
MRTALLSITGAGVLLLAGAAPSISSDVNCGIVMKSVKMGRSAQDISDTMMISTSDVEKCKAEAAKAGGETGGEKPAAQARPEAAPAPAGGAEKH